MRRIPSSMSSVAPAYEMRIFLSPRPLPGCSKSVPGVIATPASARSAEHTGGGGIGRDTAPLSLFRSSRQPPGGVIDAKRAQVCVHVKGAIGRSQVRNAHITETLQNHVSVQAVSVDVRRLCARPEEGGGCSTKGRRTDACCLPPLSAKPRNRVAPTTGQFRLGVLGERRYGCDLREARRTDGDVLVQAIDGVVQVVRRNEPAQAPARHRVEL